MQPPLFYIPLIRLNGFQSICVSALAYVPYSRCAVWSSAHHKLHIVFTCYISMVAAIRENLPQCVLLQTTSLISSALKKLLFSCVCLYVCAFSALLHCCLL